MYLTTKSIYSLENGESTVCCKDDKEYKEAIKLNELNIGHYIVDSIPDSFGSMVITKYA